MPATPTVQRVAQMRARRATLGLVRVEVWAHPDDRPRLLAYAAKLRKARERATGKGVKPGA